MKYVITSNYYYYNNEIVEMYFINGIPFTFDNIEKVFQNDSYIKSIAENNYVYTVEDMYNFSNYLILEECHPLLFELELENPEKLPID